jgi:hypothetical protein
VSKWIPKIGEYYYFTSYRIIVYSKYIGCGLDLKRLKTKRVFKTKEEAERSIFLKYLKTIEVKK